MLSEFIVQAEKAWTDDPLSRHCEDPPTTGSKFQGSKIAVKNGTTVKQPLTFELYDLGPCLYTI